MNLNSIVTFSILILSFPSICQATEIQEINEIPLTYYDRQGEEQGKLTKTEVKKLKLPIKVLSEHAGFLKIQTSDGRALWLDEYDVDVNRSNEKQRIICKSTGTQNETEVSTITSGAGDKTCP